ncbi:MAG: DUF6458 family protein [Acidimicrobiia bacterium]
MGIGVGIFLIAVGAILTFAVDLHTSGIDLSVVGVILMIVGAIGILASFMLFGDHGYYSRSRRVVYDDEVDAPARRSVVRERRVYDETY